MGDIEEQESGADAHRFGGPWTLIKLEALQKYLTAYTTALKKQSYRLLYIDTFAGTGNCDVGMGSETFSLPGSARIALETTPAFHDLIFIEQDTGRCAALRTLATSHPGRTLKIIQGEAMLNLPSSARARIGRKHEPCCSWIPMALSWSGERWKPSPKPKR